MISGIFSAEQECVCAKMLGIFVLPNGSASLYFMCLMDMALDPPHPGTAALLSLSSTYSGTCETVCGLSQSLALLFLLELALGLVGSVVASATG